MSKIIVQGILFDKKSSFQQGPALAPPLIREALHAGSMNLYTENGQTIDIEAVEDKGDFTVNSYFDIERITANHLTQCDKVLTLGGDHSIAFPIIKAYQQKYPNLDVLQIDAHPDLYHEFEGDLHSHACPFARIMEQGLAKNLVQVGIRCFNPHQRAQAEKYEVQSYEMKDWGKKPLPTKFDNPLYISLDLDGFDPAFAPGVSHHEPGGLTTRQVISLLQNIETAVVGADIVEYNPNRDVNKMTAFLAAKMMKELLGKLL